MKLSTDPLLWTLLLRAILLVSCIDAFVISPSKLHINSSSNRWLTLYADRPRLEDSNRQQQQPKKVFAKKKPMTAADLREELLKNPAKFQPTTTGSAAAAAKKKKSSNKRTRRRVENPKQQYVYASSRRLQTSRTPTDTDETTSESSAMNTNTNEGADARLISTREELALARDMGLQPAAQHCDAADESVMPVIVGQIRVGDNDTTTASSAMTAYLIEKPAGWSILGSGGGGGVSSSHKKPSQPSTLTDDSALSSTEKEETTLKRKEYIKRVQVKDADGSVDVLEYSELDVLALLTPEELEEYEAELAQEQAAEIKRLARIAKTLSNSPSLAKDDTATDMNMSTLEVDVETNVDEDDAVVGVDLGKDSCEQVVEEETELDPQTAANLRRIAARAASVDQEGAPAMFSSTASRPSVVSWLKDRKAAAGTPIRGGNVWTAVAGATEVDDSGLVLLCPKSNVDNIFVEYAEYVAVVGNGGHLDPSPKKLKADKKNLSQEAVKMEVVSRLRKGRGEDVVQTVKVLIPERKSTCAQVVDSCQEQFKEGIRGDPAASPFDRRAHRRLIHCNAISVSSLIHDDSLQAETDGFPDDIAVLAERRNHLEFKAGSFLGRSSLRDSPLTTAFREINGAADGFPGWTVDRYGEWLAVYHDPKQPKGPLPSIHDGKTTGVYYLESNPDRSTMGSESEIRPRLLEGRPAPDVFPVVENGVTYLVSINRDLSTGIFLDQRPQRAWLTRNCCPDTRVLNCFAHTGAFSVAAAAAGASTVSLDLSKKWLDRLPDQLKANGIEFDERHDCVYGDCFDWLARLAKRNEKYDIVILDPPSTSIGQKRKRWSIKDMDELVALAAGLVKKGGLLFTTTNSASMPAVRFARLCRKGLEDAGIANAKLERIQPMPADFPSIGSQPVKNLVWRIP